MNYTAQLMWDNKTERIYSVNYLVNPTAIPITLGKLYVDKNDWKPKFVASFGLRLTFDDMNGIIKVMKFVGQ